MTDRIPRFIGLFQMIQIGFLKKAFTSLQFAMKRAATLPEDLELRDACIQRFEYTFELCIKLTKRYIEQEMPIHEQIDQLNYRELIRLAFEAGLIEKVEPWFQYREARNQTSHAYDEKKAQDVYRILPSFEQDVEYLCEQFDVRLAKSKS